MKVMVIGSGGREHALVWKLSQSKRVKKIYVTPGNDGMTNLAKKVDMKVNNIIEIADFAEEEKIDITIVGPEQPLSLGIVDEFNNRNLKIFGPTQKAAMIETSKSFAKDFMKKNNIPTAEFQTFYMSVEALNYVEKAKYPLVIKADGLAGGKGVVICNSKKEAQETIKAFMLEKKFGKSGEKIIIEKFLKGKEMSFIGISDGKRVLPLVTSMDYKKVYDGDKGPNTGGMGAISPAPQINENLFNTIMKEIMYPTIEGLRFENKEFRGVLYAGLMITNTGPKVLEFNVRFGDPETQVIMLRLKSDLIDIIEGSVEGALYDIPVEWKEKISACVVLTSKGYPLKYDKGKLIDGLERAKAQGVEIFHAGTLFKDNKFYTNGGRVLNVCSLGDNLESVMDKIYNGISFITFDNMYFRGDIGRLKND